MQIRLMMALKPENAANLMIHGDAESIYPSYTLICIKNLSTVNIYNFSALAQLLQTSLPSES